MFAVAKHIAHKIVLVSNYLLRKNLSNVLTKNFNKKNLTTLTNVNSRLVDQKNSKNDKDVKKMHNF